MWAETVSTVGVTGDGEKVDDKNKAKEKEEGGEGRGEKDLKKEVAFLTVAIEARLVLQEKTKGGKENTKDWRARKNTDREPNLSVSSDSSSQAAGPADKQSVVAPRRPQVL
jgi:NAD-dependent histone deacetylase SIR2